MTRRRTTGRHWALPLLIALACGVLSASGPSGAWVAAPDPVRAENGLVVSASIHASEAGVEMLRKGGNAFDAAAATGFALAVTHPQAGNLGGGGFLVAVRGDGRVIALDFRETAPAAATRDMFIDERGEVDSSLSLRSALASGVPGSVDGLLTFWRDHGSGEISREELLGPAIRLARDGFTLTRADAAELNGRRTFFERDEAAAAIFIRADDEAWEKGDLFRQPDLAQTLQRIAEHGRDGFYGGEVAELIERKMRKSGGLISRADLAAYRPIYRDPVRGSFGEYKIVSMPPPSSGGVLLVQMLNMLEPFALAEIEWNSSGYVHLLTEVQRRAYADRAVHLGDPDFWEVPVEHLTSKTYAAERMRDYSASAATPSASVAAGDIAQAAESTETTHYSVADRFGNAVAVTTTLNAGYGSGLVVDGAGFLLNNEMDDFSAKPGVPNLYGLIGGEANAIAPGKRMLSSMTPTVVLREEKPWLILGSPGGSTIITTVLQVILNVTVHGMDVQEAVSAPRHHSQWLPDQINHEARGLSKDVRERLRAMGHSLEAGGEIGQANCILLDASGIYGAPDPRGENAAAGH